MEAGHRLFREWRRSGASHPQTKGTPVSLDTSLAFVAPFAVAATVSSENQQWLNTLWRVVAQTPLEASDYYGNTIKLLSMIVVSGNWWAP